MELPLGTNGSMRQIMRIKFSLQWLKIYNSSGKDIKTRKGVGMDMKIDNILLEMNNGFSVDYQQ